MLELRLQIDGTHKGGYKKPGETLTADYRNNIMLLFCKQASDRENITHMTTY